MYQPNDIGPTGDSVRVLGRELNTTIRWTSIINLTFISQQVFGNGYDTECIFQVRHEISYRKILSYFPCLNIFPRTTIRGRSRCVFSKGGRGRAPCCRNLRECGLEGGGGWRVQQMSIPFKGRGHGTFYLVSRDGVLDPGYFHFFKS